MRCDEGGKATLATFDKTVQNESFAFDDHKLDEDVFCVGAAIVNLIDRTHYAFSISISYYHLTDQLKEDMIDAVTKTDTIIEFQIETYAD